MGIDTNAESVPAPPVDTVERHYDAQASNNVSRTDALRRRKKGALINYKRHANAVKRLMIERYAGRCRLLVDLGCGRGGDINKWREASVCRVIALDLSSAQLDEARRRERQDPSRNRTDVSWIHASMTQPDLHAVLRPLLAHERADAIACQFAVQYAFDREETISRVLGVVSETLQEGGVFFGVAPDADAIVAQLANRRETHFRPPDHPFSLLLRLSADAPPKEFGSELLFSLEDTVLGTAEDDGCTEFLCYRHTLVRLAAGTGWSPSK